MERFTIHGLRRTFNDLTRRAGVDGVVIKSLTGHVTEKMREPLLHGRARREAHRCIERASSRSARTNGPDRTRRRREACASFALTGLVELG